MTFGAGALRLLKSLSRVASGTCRHRQEAEKVKEAISRQSLPSTPAVLVLGSGPGGLAVAAGGQEYKMTPSPCLRHRVSAHCYRSILRLIRPPF